MWTRAKQICLECYSILGEPLDNELEDFNNEYDSLYKENNDKWKQHVLDNNHIYIEPNKIGQGTKIYKK